MRTVKNENLVLTKKSPFTKYKSKNSKYANSLYGHMFLEDMCADFAIHFSPFSQSDDFFIVKPQDSKIKNLLEYSNYHFLRYEFSKLLSKNMYKLLLDGICYVEIVLGFEEKELKAISLIPFDVIRSIKRQESTKFYAINHQGEHVNWIISDSLFIKHDLRDLGIKRNYFKRILKGLSSKGIPDFGWINRAGISIADYDNRQILNTLRLVGDTYWDIRNRNNEYINEIYLLYRRVMHDAYRFKFFEYLLSQYNSALKILGTQYNFNGEIAFSVDINSHKKELSQLLSGDINCEKMGDFLFKFK